LSQAADPAAGQNDASSTQSVGRVFKENLGVISARTPPVGPDPLAQYRHATPQSLLSELTPTIATAVAGGTAWAAFVIFGKRRRDDEEPSSDSLLAAAAATGLDIGAGTGLPPVDESTMPRWRRPSLQQVRKADPLRAVAEAPHMSFATNGVRPLESFERRQIRYRLVRLLDCPDELRASEIGIIDRGDEVQLLERHGVYWRVLCPDGRQGWVHRMTLADAAGETVETAAEPPEATVFDAPVETETYASAEAEPSVDGLLEAYMRARSDVMPALDELAPMAVDAEICEPAAAAEPTVAAEPAVAEQAQAPQPDPQPEPQIGTSPQADPAPSAGSSVAMLALDYLQRAGFSVETIETTAQPAQPAAEDIVVQAVEPVVASVVEAVVEPAAEAAGAAVVETAPETVAAAAAESAIEAPSETSVQPSVEATLVAEPGHAGERYSGRKTAGTRKAATASRPGTKPRRPSR
jgi:hypothetical protein